MVRERWHRLVLVCALLLTLGCGGSSNSTADASDGSDSLGGTTQDLSATQDLSTTQDLGTTPDTTSKPVQGQPCPGGVCADGLTCIEYYGIAGPAGPKFSSCEISCGDLTKCPDGQTCVDISDGPGQVCRPK